MKNFITIIIILSILPLSGIKLAAQNSPAGYTRKILFSIGVGEKPIFNESIIKLSPIGNSVIVLTSDEEGRIYVYDNGRKRGPFRELNQTGVIFPQDDPNEFDPIFRKESDSDYEKYISYDDAGQINLKFGGKSFGPYQFILEFYLSADKNGFYAIVMKENKPQIIGSAGNRFELDGQPGFNCISPSGRKMMVTTVRENYEAGEQVNRDLSKLSAEQVSKIGKETEAKQKSKPPEAYVWFQDGKKFGPYDPKKITGNNPAFLKTGGDNWVLTMNSKLYINGIATKDLINEFISPANIWLTEDGKRYAIIVYNRIEFSDGSVYKDPLKIRIDTSQKKIMVWWLAVENGKDIVLNSKTL
jgi:hypothetical protein